MRCAYCLPKSAESAMYCRLRTPPFAHALSLHHCWQGDGAWEPRARSCRRSSLKASGSSNSTDDQVRLGTSHGLDEPGQPCLRCKTSSGNMAEHSQDSKGSSSDRSSLAEDLFESQGNGTPASHPRGTTLPCCTNHKAAVVLPCCCGWSAHPWTDLLSAALRWAISLSVLAWVCGSCRNLPEREYSAEVGKCH